MLLPEASLARLVEQLRAMPGADRKAILARLSPEERKRVRARLARRAGDPVEPASPYSADIAARIASADTALTATGRAALDRFLAPAGSEVPRQDLRGASLAQTMSGLLRPRGRHA